MQLILFFFWLAAGILLYANFGYPVIIFFLSQLRKKNSPISQNGKYITELPSIALVTACYNEAAILEQKIENSFALDYPPDKLSFIFVADGSTDGSENILEKYPRITVLFQPLREGKASALNRAIKIVSTDLVVFTDANSFLNTDSLKKLVTHFADENTGAVAGEKIIAVSPSEPATAKGESLYWKYESCIKKMDADLYSTVGAAGEIFAIRRNLYRELVSDTILDDFTLSIACIQQGYRIAYEPQAFSVEKSSVSLRDEWIRRKRIATGNWQSLFRINAAAFLSHRPVFFFQYFSQRIIRRAVSPFAIPALLILNFLLLPSHFTWAKYTWYAQLFFYGTSLPAYGLSIQNKKAAFLSIPLYFCMIHFAAIAGLYQYVFFKQDGKWERINRPVSP